MNEINKIIFDKKKNKCQVLCSESLLDTIRFAFSTPNEAKQFVKGDKKKFIPDRNYWVGSDARFSLGLLKSIINTIKFNKEEVELDNSFAFLKNICKSNEKIIQIPDENFKLYDYQEETLLKCIKNGYGLAELATGAGKTYIMVNLIYNLFKNNWNTNERVLLLVPDKGLLNQTYEEFIKFGVPINIICRFGDGYTVDLSCNIIIATNKILLSKNRDYRWLKDINYLIVDEVHGIKRGNEIYKIIKNIPTFHKWGFTGTIPKNRDDYFTLLSVFGDILYKKTSFELRNEDILSHVEAEITEIIHKVGPKYIHQKEMPADNWFIETDFITNNVKRNEFICNKALSLKGNTLIIVDRLIHGENLYNTLNCSKKYFIQGETDVETERVPIINEIESQEGIVIIAIAKIFSMGINIKNLHNLIFAFSGKSDTRIIQSIGRTLRKHSSKDKAMIYDISDNLMYGSKHLQERIQIYNNEKINFRRKEVYLA